LNSDSKVRIQTRTQTRFYYPDAAVVCGENLLDGVFQDKPTLIVEVLSDTTRRTDEGEKLDAYQKIAELNVYIMFEQNLTGAVVYRRSGTEFHREVYFSPESIIALPEIGVDIPLASVYEEVPFVAEAEESQRE
jgi:Uma2 family endonuclease